MCELGKKLDDDDNSFLLGGVSGRPLFLLEKTTPPKKNIFKYDLVYTQSYLRAPGMYT